MTNEKFWKIPLWLGVHQHINRIVREPDKNICTSSKVQGSYSLVYKIPGPIKACRSDLTVTFDADVLSGVIGFGAIQSDGSSFLAETACEAGAQPAAFTIQADDIAKLANLVIRNLASGDSQSEFVVRSITAEAA
ncbi:hypothetical protein [Tardiphaga sp. 709]|jgi:hypothetical protein|uniref:hypothetical protein n=1 Tax=unclassified Tardiphaga TaxID=2631404 RepID=UPI0028E33F88|nr:hypothetical protein [Tardiphaga sp. 709]WNV09139.1 hypothetical protein RSO67_27360 [Tardiphaga sp. 709]